MFGFGKEAKIRKAVERAFATIDAEDEVPDCAAIEALPQALHVEAYGQLASTLFSDERYEAARAVVDQALAIAPDQLSLLKLGANIDTEMGQCTIDLLTHIVKLAPRDYAWIGTLASHLIAAERLDEAVELLEPHRGARNLTIGHRLAEALFLQGNNPEALEILDAVCAAYESALSDALGAEWHEIKSDADEASRLRDDVHAAVHGREATIELAALARRLDGRSGVNYRLLGMQLATKSERVAAVLELEDPDATEQRARELLRESPDTPGGLTLLGSAQLRRGEIAAARKSFDRACEVDGRYFPAFLGVGAVLDHETYALHRRAKTLPPAPELPVLARVVPSLRVLTDLERRVVWASVEAFRESLSALADEKVVMHVLPIDVRATDIGLFDDVAGERHESDQRSYDAITGLATHGGAIAKIEGLLDTASGDDWVFAHEFAHLVFYHMPEPQAAPIVELFERACEVGYASTDYALSNIDEFFAVSYVEWLRVRHEHPGAPIPDDAGIHDALIAYFDALRC